MSNSFRSMLVCLAASVFVFTTLPTSASQLSSQLWGSEPVESLTSTRQRICLNGVWNFVPAQGAYLKVAPPVGDVWGAIRVPGSWMAKGWPPVLGAELEVGTGPAWTSGWQDDLGMNRMWYRREIQVPANWAGQRITLRFAGVGTDAEVFVGGKEAGKILFPSGEVEISDLVKPGSKTDVLVRVVVSGPETVSVLMGYANDGKQTANTIRARGILDNVFLEASPRGPRIADTIIQTSTRENKLTVEGTLVNGGTGNWKLRAKALDQAGKPVREFADSAPLMPANGALTASWEWMNPPLWSPENPTMLTLQVQLVDGSGKVVDEIREPFGFREFWIDGKDFYLNGVKTRLRPAIHGTPMHQGFPEVFDALIEDYKAMGSNFVEFWPGDIEARTTYQYTRLFAERASAKGILVSGIAPHLNKLIKANPGGTLPADKLEKFDQWATQRMIRDSGLINLPSVVLWGSSGNTFSPSYNVGPFAPQNIGILSLEDYPEGPNVGVNRASAKLGQSLVDRMKQIDPTRPIFTHHGGAVGDFQTANMYLNLIPLQEREEWYSHWAEHGKRPFMVVEHGDPFNLTFHRGRAGFGNSIGSEPFPTEHLAAYLGAESYQLEPDDFRKAIAEKHKSGQSYEGWWSGQPFTMGQNYQELLSLFVRNTNRAWRTWGSSGGTLSWQLRDSGWKPVKKDAGTVNLPPFVPGRQGLYASELPAEMLNHYREENRPVTATGQAHVQTNQPTLAYLAGFDPAEKGYGKGFTDKRHNFFLGASVEKQIVLINDSEGKLPYAAKWSANLAGAELGMKELQGELEPGEIKFIKLDFRLPEQITMEKADGALTLDATIGEDKFNDTLPFRVFQPTKSTQAQPFLLYDPVGETAKMLQELGIPSKAWKPGDSADAGVLIIGRRALEGSENLPPEVQEFVEGGGRCIIMAQNPDWMRKNFGFRVSWFLSRRAFPVDASHPVLAGLDEMDLRDWAGSSTLVPSHPNWVRADSGDPVLRFHGKPYAGWRWGNRGALTSAAIETPHHGGWTPVLACEFDMAFSPLLEKGIGNGWLALCLLDFEDQIAADPAARKLALQFFDYAREMKPEPAVRTYGLGLGAWTKLLEETGLIFEDTSALPEPPAMVVIGPKAGLQEAQLDAFLAKGGRALVLPSEDGSGRLGTKTKRMADFAGSTQVPDWPEAGGLGPSDLRLRAELSWPVLTEGVELGAGGLLGLRREGPGVAVFVQFDPDALEANKRTYLRHSRWRQTRALCQILGNLGARFNSDRHLAEKKGAAEIPLTKGWKAALIHRHEAPKRFEDRVQATGISPEAKNAVAPGFNDSAWETVSAPRAWEEYGGEWFNADGEAVFRFVVDIPEAWAGRPLELGLGRIHAFDNTFWNGVEVGSTGTEVKDAFKQNRRYLIPGDQVRAGKNVLAVRIYNDWSDGGFRGAAADLFIRPARSGGGFYHTDYRDDFEFGDDPFRYFNW